MKRDFENLTQRTFDLVVIGGGIIGTGIARDAALRGLDTLLVEREDFACGTTSRSTRLIHGGLRYLRMLEFKLVRQDLREREILMHIAPHLVNKIQFIIPLLRSQFLYRLALPLGLFLYDVMASGKTLPSRQYLSLKETLRVEPSLQDTADLTESFLFYDCQAPNMERLCLENALSAAAKGACILNHAEATDFLLEDGVVKGIFIKDKIAGRDYVARGRLVLNAGGPWANIVWNKLGTGHRLELRRTKGIHLVTRKLANRALVLFAKSDGRLFFIIPWKDCSLIGTTDTDYTGDLDVVAAEKSDVDYLLTETHNYFPQFKKEDIHYAVAGLRPLVSDGEKAESNTSRVHKLIDHEHQDRVKGLISILGGKITAYRAIAEEAVDLVCKKLKVKIPCTTALTPLPGAPALNEQDISKIAREKGMSFDIISHLASVYGSRLLSVLTYIDEDKRLARPIKPGYPDICAQIKHAVIEEEALSVSDFMLRRSNLGLSPAQGLDAVEAVMQEMAFLLGWSNQEQQTQLQDYLASVAISKSFQGR